jgi:ferredoxin-thioredoxin reductase catalytic subunit
MNIESRKKALRHFYENVISPIGYKFSPDESLVDFLLEQEVKIEQKYGFPFCPCQPRMRDRKHDFQIICPCIPFHREHYDAMKRCWCGLFVHKDVSDPDKLRQIPLEEIKGR